MSVNEEMSVREKRRKADIDRLQKGEPIIHGTLGDKISELLGRLALLTEAPAGNLEAQIAKSAPESSAPSGGLIGTDRSAQTIRDLSLYDWYRQQFERHRGDYDRLLSLYLAGEREWLRRVDRRTHERTAEKGSILAYSHKGSDVEDIASLRIIEEFEGVHALDVAIVEGQTEAHVLKIRRQHDRNPQDGRPRAEFRGWDEERRTAVVARLAEQCKTKQEVADLLGVDRGTVSRYWPAEPMAVAA